MELSEWTTCEQCMRVRHQLRADTAAQLLGHHAHTPQPCDVAVEAEAQRANDRLVVNESDETAVLGQISTYVIEGFRHRTARRIERRARGVCPLGHFMD